MKKVYDADILLTKIKAWAHHHNVAPYHIALEVGLSPGALRDMFKGTWNPKISTIRLVEDFIENYEAKRRALAANPSNVIKLSKPKDYGLFDLRPKA